MRIETKCANFIRITNEIKRISRKFQSLNIDNFQTKYPVVFYFSLLLILLRNRNKLQNEIFHFFGQEYLKFKKEISRKIENSNIPLEKRRVHTKMERREPKIIPGCFDITTYSRINNIKFLILNIKYSIHPNVIQITESSYGKLFFHYSYCP